VAALQGHHDQLRSAELEKARRMLAGGAAPEKVLESLARGLTNKLLHAPLAALNSAGDAERAELIAMLQRVYGLDEPQDGEH
jgi:glutamyl-tRNA reductase